MSKLGDAARGPKNVTPLTAVYFLNEFLVVLKMTQLGYHHHTSNYLHVIAYEKNKRLQLI